jgi:hypothetical protein
MNQLKKCTAIKGLLFAALLFAGSITWAAQVAGTVTNLSGALLAKKADGTVKILALRSEVESGDTLVSEKNTYAQVKFIDNSEITLKPNTTFKIEQFEFDEGKPAGDNASFSLVRGGLRSITGLLGKRNKEKFALKTPTATIGIRGTTFIAEYVEPSPEAVAAQLAYLQASTAALGSTGVAGVVPLQLAQLPLTPPGPGVRAPGLYVAVLDGLIHVTNPAGSSNFAAGQFGYTPSFRTPPVLLPINPGIPFTPPPAFNSSSGDKTGPYAGSGKSNTVDCEVR